MDPAAINELLYASSDDESFSEKILLLFVIHARTIKGTQSVIARRLNLVWALNNANSSLRKSLDGRIKKDYNFLNVLQNNGYSKDDFCSYKNEVIKSVCKLLKINCNSKNLKRTFKRCQVIFRKDDASVSQVELFQNDVIMLDQENNLSRNTEQSVKRRLFNDGSPRKENSHETKNVEKFSLNFKYDDVENKEQDFIIHNPDLFNSPFEFNDDYCYETRVADNEKEIISIQNINKTEEPIITFKRKLEIFNTGDLFTPKKSYKSIVVCTTPEADLRALPRNSKNVYPLNVRNLSNGDGSKKITDFKKCTLVGIVNLQDEELKHIIPSIEQKNVFISDEINDLLRETFETVNNSCVLTIKRTSHRSFSAVKTRPRKTKKTPPKSGSRLCRTESISFNVASIGLNTSSSVLRNLQPFRLMLYG
ncbi:uncharacterized protein LOC112686262 [Sipha flava]|uniref:Uncharacterized protein LOC112686262 n=1 Tax=Sipha flava TaxID=143950 RepID=A0A8B8FTX6_9HEMI|nr:uncharacterized protein LOC112686262 [Sipha flava]